MVILFTFKILLCFFSLKIQEPIFICWIRLHLKVTDDDLPMLLILPGFSEYNF